MLGRLYGNKNGTHPTAEECIANFKEMLEGTDIENLLRKGGEQGIGPGPGISDSYLLRWLKSEGFDTAKCIEKLQKQAEWRSSYVPDGFIHGHEIQSELDDNKFFILEKCDKFGRPVFLEISNRHFRKTCDLNQNRRMIVYGMDLCLKLAEAAGGDGKVTSVFDMRGVQLEHVDVAATRQVIDVITHHFPERWMSDP